MADIRRRFRTIWKFLIPGWLQRGQGELVQYTQGLLKDAFAEASHQTALLHFPSVCADDALDMHGRSRGLPRGVLESADAYRTRLLGWRYPKGHRVRGTRAALLEQFVLALRGDQHVIIDSRNRRLESGAYPTFAPPVLQAVGAYSGAVGDATVTWPAHLAGDLGLMTVVTINEAVATPAGWTLLGSAGVGTPGSIGTGVRLQVFSRVATSASESNVTLVDAGFAQAGLIVTYRGGMHVADFAIAASADAGSTSASTPAQADSIGGICKKLAIFVGAGNGLVSGYTSAGASWSEIYDVGGTHRTNAAAETSSGAADGPVTATLSASVRSVGAYVVLSSPTHDTWIWDAMPPEAWARYWLVCHSVGTPWSSFSDPGWIAAWGDPNAVLAGGDITFGELDAVVKLASNRRLGWTPAGVQAQVLVLYFGDDPFPQPDGEWDEWANRDTRYRYVSLSESVS